MTLARVLRGSLSGLLVLSRAASGGAIGALVGVLAAGDGASLSHPLPVSLAVAGVLVAAALVGWRGHGGKRGVPRAVGVVSLAVLAFLAIYATPATTLAPAYFWQLSIGAGVLAAAVAGVLLLEPPAPSESSSEAS